MSKNTIRAFVVLAIVLCTFSVVAFAAPFKLTALFWIAYAFGVLSIILQLYVMKVSSAKGGDARSVAYGIPIIRIGVMYVILQLAISIAEMALQKRIPLWVVIVVNVVLLAIAAIGCISAEAVRDEIVKQDQKRETSVMTMREIQSTADMLLAQTSDANVKKVAEEIKYSDPKSSQSTLEKEEVIKELMTQLLSQVDEGNEEEISDTCNKISKELTERNRLCKLNK